MELKEYIKQSYLRPNKQVLESLGASDELIEYLRTTPWNTNLNVLKAYGHGGGSYTTLTEETVETKRPSSQSPVIFGTLSYSESLTADALNITIDGKLYENVPKVQGVGQIVYYGTQVKEMTESSEYPFNVTSVPDRENSFYTPTEGVYTIKIEVCE